MLTTRPGARRALVVLVSLAIATSLVAACAGYGALPFTSSGTQTLDVAIAADAPAVTVTVEMFNGDIEVRAGEPGQVTAEVTTTGAGGSKDEAEADRAKIQVTLDANPDGSVLLRAVYQPNPSSPSNRAASAVVDVPPGAALALDTSNGRVDVSGVGGTIAVETSNGAVDLAGATAGATVRTSNNGVEIDGGGTLDVETSNAAIVLFGEQATVRADTSNATISFEGSLAEGAQWLETTNQAIYVRLPSGSSFGIDAQTSGGHEVVVTGFDVRTTGASGEGILQGTVGTGGPSLTLRTSNASIEVSTLD